jgi:hypothetical protein
MNNIIGQNCDLSAVDSEIEILSFQQELNEALESNNKIEEL